MKRLLDVVLAFFILVMISPLLIFVALLIYFFIGKPILFKQARPGLNGKLFKMYKFRTMLEKPGFDDKERMTALGSYLRSLSVDELPGLWNVLIGDMSLVGPRPLLVDYLPLYTEKQARRHDVRPGVTGWAQVNGRNAISWEEKFALDVWYVDNRTLWLDIKILFMTVKKVFVKEGISADGHVTIEPFTGSEEQGRRQS